MTARRTASKRAAKKPARPARKPPREFDDLTLPGGATELDDEIAVTLSPEGVAAFRPMSWDRFSAAERQGLGDLMVLVGRRRQLGEEIGEVVVHLRHHGLPWSAIAWATGMTGEGARRRWS